MVPRGRRRFVARIRRIVRRMRSFVHGGQLEAPALSRNPVARGRGFPPARERPNGRGAVYFQRKGYSTGLLLCRSGAADQGPSGIRPRSPRLRRPNSDRHRVRRSLPQAVRHRQRKCQGCQTPPVGAANVATAVSAFVSSIRPPPTRGTPRLLGPEGWPRTRCRLSGIPLR